MNAISRWGLVVSLGLYGCAIHPPVVELTEYCIPEHGYACHWMLALEEAESGGCGQDLRNHWSAEVRHACAEPSGEVPLGIRVGGAARHFTEPPISIDAGEAIVPTVDERLLRRFSFPAVKDGLRNWPKLDHEHGVTVVTATQYGTLVGIDRGEWGGGLVWLPSRGKAQLLFRAPIQHVFEAGESVYVVADDYLHLRLYALTREGTGRSAKWRLEHRFLLPGRHLQVRRVGAKTFLITDSGTVTLHATGAIDVGP